jgi:hypothetical protein
MGALLAVLLFALFGAIGWCIDWFIVRLIIIPSVAAIWGRTLPFWPVMGLFVVLSMLLGGCIKISKKE